MWTFSVNTKDHQVSYVLAEAVTRALNIHRAMTEEGRGRQIVIYVHNSILWTPLYLKRFQEVVTRKMRQMSKR